MNRSYASLAENISPCAPALAFTPKTLTAAGSLRYGRSVTPWIAHPPFPVGGCGRGGPHVAGLNGAGGES
jgi:hypothetical protein